MGICSGMGHTVPNPERVDETHFKILSTIGKGGFGKVKVAIDRKERNKTKRRNSIYTRSDSHHALKFQDLRSLIQNPALWNNVWNERNLMAKCKSPFVVNLQYAFLNSLDLVLVMPFLRGGDLGYYLERGGAMKEAEARFYAAEILLGLRAIHELKYVYRDLKLENCLLDAEGHVVITDLGLAVPLLENDTENKGARFEDRYPKPHHLRTRGCAGTPGYIAPELINLRSYDFMCDFFTFGATIAKLLSMRTPFNPKLMDKGEVSQIVKSFFCHSQLKNRSLPLDQNYSFLIQLKYFNEVDM